MPELSKAGDVRTTNWSYFYPQDNMLSYFFKFYKTRAKNEKCISNAI